MKLHLIVLPVTLALLAGCQVGASVGANGSGLGLSIARGAAERCGFSLTLRNREDRSGLIARIERTA